MSPAHTGAGGERQPASAPTARRIASRQHPVLKTLRRTLHSGRRARRSSRYVLDGIHLVEEALSAGSQPEAVIVAPGLARTAAGRALLERLQEAGWPRYEASDALLRAHAPTQSPQGVLALMQRPPMPAPDRWPSSSHAPLPALVLAGLQDPLNLGALARSAWAFGTRTVIALQGTVDPFHPRALRASSGALLHAQVIDDVELERFAQWLSSRQGQAAALVTTGGIALERAAASTPRPLALVLGSEGGGVPEAVLVRCRQRISIPMAGKIDSLGVAAAGAIALYALGRASAPRSAG